MKRQIRRGVFETNSSSVHSMTMCNNEQYSKWKDGEILYWEDEGKFATREEIIKELKTMTWYNGRLRYDDVNWDDECEVNAIFFEENIKTCKEYFDNEWFYTFEERHTTPNGDEVVAFGYYGYDG